MVSERLKDALRAYTISLSISGIPEYLKLRDCLLSVCEQQTDTGFAIAINEVLKNMPQIIGGKYIRECVWNICTILATDGERYINEGALTESMDDIEEMWGRDPELSEWIIRWKEKFFEEHIS